jgi:uncharacterized membrane protein HdeD (DUF308 family)
MKRRSRVPVLLWILLIACVLPIVYAIVKRREEYVLWGLIPAVILGLALLVYMVRSRQFEKILRREGHLLHFEYTSMEAEEVIDHELPKFKKASRGLALLFGVCLLVIAIPFAQLMQKNSPDSPVWAVYACAALVPVLGALYAPRVLKRRIRKSPCATCVGMDYILIANRYPGINDYGKLKLDCASFMKTEPGTMRWMRLDYSFVAMKNATRIQKSVEVPVPRDQTAGAESFVRQFVKREKATR